MPTGGGASADAALAAAIAKLPRPPPRGDAHRATRHPLLAALLAALPDAEWWQPNVIHLVLDYAAEMVHFAVPPADPKAPIDTAWILATLGGGPIRAAVNHLPNRFLILSSRNATLAVELQWPNLPRAEGIPGRVVHTFGDEPQCAYSPVTNTLYKSVPNRHCFRALQVGDIRGTSHRVVGKFGKESDRFNTPLGLAWTHASLSFIGAKREYLSVCDAGNQRVSQVELTAHGTFLFRKAIGGPDRFKRPVSVTTLDTGVFVVDMDAHCVVQFKDFYTHVRTFGTHELIRPTGVASFGTDLYVADPGFGCVHRFAAATGEYLGFFGTEHTPEHPEKRRSYHSPLTLARTDTHLIVRDTNEIMLQIFPLARSEMEKITKKSTKR